ncbi:MAG: membrane protein insertion efficiency factor YidD [Proteobacteria bacterium]|nr:membrane protein insertion efficiency factor YidD [Pseudomonadota bacterium]
MNKIIIFLLQIYRLVISPFLKNACRFTPSCSCYAIEAFKKHSPKTAIILTIKRLLKCQPFSKAAKYQGQYDPVPDETKH